MHKIGPAQTRSQSSMSMVSCHFVSGGPFGRATSKVSFQVGVSVDFFVGGLELDVQSRRRKTCTGGRTLDLPTSALSMAGRSRARPSRRVVASMAWGRLNFDFYTRPRPIRSSFGSPSVSDGAKGSRRHRVVDPLQKELDVAGDLALPLVALLELVPFPDRFVVRQGAEVHGELAHRGDGVRMTARRRRRGLGRRGAAPMKSASSTSSVNDGDEPSPGTSNNRTNCSWNLGSRHFLTVWLFQGSSTPVSSNGAARVRSRPDDQQVFIVDGV